MIIEICDRCQKPIKGAMRAGELRAVPDEREGRELKERSAAYDLCAKCWTDFHRWLDNGRMDDARRWRSLHDLQDPNHTTRTEKVRLRSDRLREAQERRGSEPDHRPGTNEPGQVLAVQPEATRTEDPHLKPGAEWHPHDGGPNA